MRLLSIANLNNKFHHIHQRMLAAVIYQRLNRNSFMSASRLETSRGIFFGSRDCRRFYQRIKPLGICLPRWHTLLAKSKSKWWKQIMFSSLIAVIRLRTACSFEVLLLEQSRESKREFYQICGFFFFSSASHLDVEMWRRPMPSFHPLSISLVRAVRWLSLKFNCLLSTQSPLLFDCHTL